jgi:spore maturation protein CgeB
MRILKIANYYKSFYKYYYDKNPSVINLPYNEQFEHLMNQFFGWSDFYAKAFNKSGHEAKEIVYNATSIQKAWAKENNTDEKDLALLFHQIKTYSPDVVWFQDSFSFDIEFIKKVKDEIKSVKLLIGNSCAPYTQKNLDNLKVFDFVTTCSPKFVQDFEKQGIKSLLLYHTFSSEILNHISDFNKQRDLIFIGSIIPRKDFHVERKKFLETIANNSRIDFSYFGNLSNLKYSEVLKLQLLYIAKEILIKTRTNVLFKNSVTYKKLENLNSFPKYFKFSKALKDSYKGELYGINMFREYAKSKITLDIQVEVEGPYAGNIRMFETTGMGVCLLLENKLNIKEIFEPDKEVVIYNSYEEAIEKIIWLLEHEDKLIEIAKAGQKRTLTEHTYENRAEKLINEINKYLTK